jgi:hypothetical protein
VPTWEQIKNKLEWLHLFRVVVDSLLTIVSWSGSRKLLALFISPKWASAVSWFVAGAVLLALVWFQQRKSINQSGQSTAFQSASNTLVSPTQTFDAAAFFRTNYVSSLTAEGEKNILLAAAQYQPSDCAGFLARIIGIGLVAYLHDMTWAYIFKSQLLMLSELNRRGGVMSLDDAKPYYDKAAIDFPKIYLAYSYTQWLSFVKQQQLLIQHPNDELEITVKGKDFLKYLTHWGRDINARQC